MASISNSTDSLLGGQQYDLRINLYLEESNHIAEITSSGTSRDILRRSSERSRDMAYDKTNKLFVPIDTSWFKKEPEKYLAQDDFREYQEISGIDFKDLLSDELGIVGRAQKELIEQSVILMVS